MSRIWDAVKMEWIDEMPKDAVDGEDYGENKYIVFKREDYEKYVLGVESHYAEWEIKDAVVIRRQDRFASPALATYAACIAIAYHMTDDQDVKRQLTLIADYFEHQAQLAADEGHKLPDL